MSSTIEIGYGVARGEDSFKIGAQAARQALSGIENLPISIIIVFASIKYDLEEMLAGMASVTDEALVIGTTTAGDICNRPGKGNVVVAALASPYLSVSAGVGENVSADYRVAVDQAITASGMVHYFSPEEGMERRREALRQGRSAFALLFSPGNIRTADSRSYEIVELLRQRSLGQLPIVGGSSADDWRMEANYVFYGKNVYPDSLLLVLFESQLEFGIAVAHSYWSTDKKALVTKSSGRLVKELNHRPAAEVYAELLGYPLEELEGKHISLYTGKPCGVRDAYGQYHLKVATHFTAEGWVGFTPPVFEGTMLTIMESTTEELIGAAREALYKALLRGNISSPAVVFVFSCALRDKILGEKTPLEIAAMRELLPDVPLVGFYSFGEQGLTDDGVSRANHETVAVLVLGRKLSMAAQTALENARLLQEVAQAREEWGSTFDAITDSLYVVGADYTIRRVNETIRKDYKDAPPEGRKCYEVFHGEEEPCAGCPVTETFRTGQPTSAEVYDPLQDRIYHCWVYPIFREGKLVSAVQYAQDVTEKVRAEEEVKRRNRELSALNVIVAAVSQTIDLDQLLKIALDKVLEVMQAEGGGIFLIDEQAGELILRVHKGLPAEFVSKVERIKLDDLSVLSVIGAGKGILTAELPCRSEDLVRAEEEHGIGNAVSCALKAKDKPVGLINLSILPGVRLGAEEMGLLESISHQVGMAIENARLYESEQAGRQIADTLWEASKVLNSTLDLEEVLKLILDQLRRVVSYDSASIQRLTADGLEIIACRGFDEPHKVMNITFPLDPKFPNYQVVMTKEPYVIDDVRLEYPHFGEESESYQSGHIRSWLGVPLLVKNEVIGMMALDRTTSGSYSDDQARLAMAFANQAAIAIENARLYEEIRRKSDELEDEVAERTRELREAQEQLLRSERLAAIGQMASVVSHELRNPLGVIKNAAYFLQMELEEPADEVREVLDILDREVNVSNRIITDLLDFSRVRGPDFQPTDINAVIEEALERAEVMENVKVVIHLAKSLPQIQADADQMGQLFVNLITNALQAMPEGGELEVVSRQEGDFIEVAIRDTGVGIPEENLDKIFEPLFTTKAKGIGLGLAICKQLVEGHRGKIDVESGVGKGSVFTIRLPIG